MGGLFAFASRGPLGVSGALQSSSAFKARASTSYWGNAL